jgi:hypothetical protein
MAVAVDHGRDTTRVIPRRSRGCFHHASFSVHGTISKEIRTIARRNTGLRRRPLVLNFSDPAFLYGHWVVSYLHEIVSLKR